MPVATNLKMRVSRNLLAGLLGHRHALAVDANSPEEADPVGEPEQQKSEFLRCQ